MFFAVLFRAASLPGTFVFHTVVLRFFRRQKTYCFCCFMSKFDCVSHVGSSCLLCAYLRLEA